jgi:hypothetical protein
MLRSPHECDRRCAIEYCSGAYVRVVARACVECRYQKKALSCARSYPRYRYCNPLEDSHVKNIAPNTSSCSDTVACTASVRKELSVHLNLETCCLSFEGFRTSGQGWVFPSPGQGVSARAERAEMVGTCALTTSCPCHSTSSPVSATMSVGYVSRWMHGPLI